MLASVDEFKKELNELPHRMKELWRIGRSASAISLGSALGSSYHSSSSECTDDSSGDLVSNTRFNGARDTITRSVGLGSHLDDSEALASHRVAGLLTCSANGAFEHVDRKAAEKMVQCGQLLEVVAKEHGLGTRSRCCGCCCKCVKRCAGLRNSKKTAFFVVMENQNSLLELRWDSNPEKAVTELAQGRLLLSKIRDVTPVVLRDDVEEEQALASRQLRILFGHESLKIWAPDRKSLKDWCVALTSLVRSARGSSMRTKKGPDIALRGYINQLFVSIGDRRKGNEWEVTHISRSELLDWLNNLSISTSDKYVSDIIHEFHKNDNQSFDLEEFSELFHMLTVKEPLVPWFDKYATLIPLDDDEDGEGFDFSIAHRGISAERFQFFLELEQGEKQFFSEYKTIDGPDGLFASMPEPYTETIKGKTFLTQAGFSRLMCCAENDLFDPERRARVYQDMTQPLSHYWIASSHNTYLEGHQLVGLSSLEQYMDVLLRGARCVEIDCWDGEDGEPIVTHGWTATSRLQFKDVIRVCRDYAFVTSHYPLILSLEVHCNHEQRCRMASILLEIFGGTLLLPSSGQQPLISPEAARNRVIVKAKKRVHVGSSFDLGAHLNPHRKVHSRRGCRFGLCWFVKFIFCCRCLSRRSKLPQDKDCDYESDPEPLSLSRDELKEAKTLSDVVYLEGVRLPEGDKLSEFDLSLDSYPCTCISVNDTKGSRLVDSNGLPMLRKYARHQTLRVYPAAKRVGSSNFDPFSMWLAGVQMVALNYQSLDLPVICNEGLFLHENGGSGYILKPDSVRSPNELKSADIGRKLSTKCWKVAKSLSHEQQNEDALSVGNACMLELTLLSGHSLPKPRGGEEGGIVSPLVRASICGHPGDRRCAETRVITDNGFNPRWHQLFTFEISEPSVAMLILEVIHVSTGLRRARREFLAAAALPFSGIREGIRWVRLLDWKHHAIELCGLLVEVRLRGPWAELRRHQRFTREPAPSSAAREISRGPGGLMNDNVGVVSDARRMNKYGKSFMDSANIGDLSPGIASPRASIDTFASELVVGSFLHRSSCPRILHYDDPSTNYSLDEIAINTFASPSQPETVEDPNIRDNTVNTSYQRHSAQSFKVTGMSSQAQLLRPIEEKDSGKLIILL